MQVGEVQSGGTKPSSRRLVRTRLTRTVEGLKTKSAHDVYPLNPGRHGELIQAIRDGQELVEEEKDRQKERAELYISVSRGEVSVRMAVEDLERLKERESGFWCTHGELEKVLKMTDDELEKLIPNLSQDAASRLAQVGILRIGAIKILFSLNETSFKKLISNYLLPNLIDKNEHSLACIIFLSRLRKQALAKFIKNLGRCDSFGEGKEKVEAVKEKFDKCAKLLLDLANMHKTGSRFIFENLFKKSELKEDTSNQEQKVIARQQKVILAVLRNAPKSDGHVSTVGLDTAIKIYKNAASREVCDKASELMFDGFNIDSKEATQLVRDIALDTSRDCWQKAELVERGDFDKCFYRAYRMRRMQALETYLKLEPFEHYSKSAPSEIQLELEELLREKDPRIVNKVCKLLSTRNLCQEAGQELLVDTICEQIEQDEPSLPLACIASMAKYKNYPYYLDVLLELFSREIDVSKAFYRINDLQIFGINEEGKHHGYGMAQYSMHQANMLETISSLLGVLLPYIAHSMEDTVPEEDILMNNARDLVEFASRKVKEKGEGPYNRWVYKHFGSKDDPRTAEQYAALAGRSNLESIDETIDGTFAGKNLNELVDRFQPSEK